MNLVKYFFYSDGDDEDNSSNDSYFFSQRRDFNQEAESPKDDANFDIGSSPCSLDGAEEDEEEEALEEGDSFSLNALLSVEERKIVALLERIESKFGTLQENEKDEVRCSNFFILLLLEFLVCQEDLQLPRQVRLYPCQGGDHPWDVRAERALAQGQPWNSCH